MRRKRRGKLKNYKFFYITGTLLIVLSIALVILYNAYNKKLNEISESMLSTEQIIGLVPNETEGSTEETETASTTLSKTMEEVTENMTNLEAETKETTEGNIIEEDKNTEVKEKVVEPKKELVFGKPVEGEISKEFAMETLVYSETLKEWTVHQGIDIKADRTTVVKVSEAGKVTAIKNDPRYGLTVIVEHDDGYKTVYSNLLTTEFVTEGENVEKGQSLGTVGNSAVFEIADEPHLHFEMIKDGKYVNPTSYIK